MGAFEVCDRGKAKGTRFYVFLYNTESMEHTISATEFARTLGDILARVRYRHDSFIVERNGTPVARVVPVDAVGREATLGEALAAWCGAAPADPSFADDLARIGAADRPPANPWES